MRIQCKTHKRPVDVEFCDVHECAIECRDYAAVKGTAAGKMEDVKTTMSVNGGPEVNIDRMMEGDGIITEGRIKDLINIGQQDLIREIDRIAEEYEWSLTNENMKPGISVNIQITIKPTNHGVEAKVGTGYGSGKAKRSRTLILGQTVLPLRGKKKSE